MRQRDDSCLGLKATFVEEGSRVDAEYEKRDLMYERKAGTVQTRAMH